MTASLYRSLPTVTTLCLVALSLLWPHSIPAAEGVHLVDDPATMGQALTHVERNGLTLTAGIGVVAEHGIGPAQTLIANGVFGVGAALSLLFCVAVAIRRRAMFPIFAFVGACASVPVEMFVDVLGRCNWATLDQPIVAHLMGRDVPLLNLLTYMFYFPVAIVSLHLALERGMTLRAWWTSVATAIGLAWLFELYPVNARWWYYYGEGQPLMVLGLPLWWGPCAVLAVIGAGGLTYLIRRHVLRDRHSWFLVPAIPLAVMSVHISASFPIFVALSSTEDVRITTVVALFTIVIALIMAHLIGVLVTRAGQLQTEVPHGTSGPQRYAGRHAVPFPR